VPSGEASDSKPREVRPGGHAAPVAEMNRSFSGSMPELYDRFLVPLQFAPFAQDLARRLAPVTSGHLLELAAGTGVVTRALARTLPQAVHITATDLNPAMLDHAKTHAGLERVAWREADAMALPFPDAGFDYVLCQFGVMFFPDKRAAFREVKRVLRPGGQFLFNVWCDKEGTARLLAEQVVAEKLSRDAARLVAPEYNDIETVAADLTAAGFASVQIVKVSKTTFSASARAAAVANCYGGMLRAQIDKLAPGRLDEITDAVEATFTARFGDGPIEAQLHALVFTAIRSFSSSNEAQAIGAKSPA
jgi:ubiquinone/menaquinone biosynthesis C-methylase UbiE